jgi:glycosyltransferase involved in cell wall biosynthesis
VDVELTVEDPLVSVLLPVHNGRPYLEAALRSVLAQTYRNLEVIVVDDGSTDGSHEVVESCRDSRLRLLRQPNRGLPATLNRAIELARGKYLARQDADDLALPERFERQVRFLEGHPSHAMVGTWAGVWFDECDSGKCFRPPTESHLLKWAMLCYNPFIHSSTMLRSSAVREVGTYSTDPGRVPPEDFELWSRLARRFEVANLPEVLQVYRVLDTSICRTVDFLPKVVLFCAENAAWAAGLPAPDETCFGIAALANNARERVDGRFRPRDAARILEAAARRLGGASPEQESQLNELSRKRMRALLDRYHGGHAGTRRGRP